MIENGAAHSQADSVATLDQPGLGAPNPLALARAAALAEGSPLDAAQWERLARYRDLLLAWNGRFNLTAITDPIEVERRLFLDSLRLLPAIDRLTAGQAEPRLIDIGSGGGFPGLALKIARPALQVTLVDATGKKVRFLEQAIAALGLTGARALQARAEDLGRDAAFRDAFDLVTARAVAPLPVLLEYATPLLRIGGSGLFPKGRDLAAELAAGEDAARLIGARIESAELLPGGETRLVETRKHAPTPANYPRRTGLPTQAPLGGTDANRATGGRRIRRREGPAAQPSPSERA
ncbi:MAG TPA: 16S rRNA (guanine(527)-N(7))-methyltransferase RsmG, partial [Thermomicrobiales bacterium]|nr:16S rRNA (guanine(527)-N(7))-methyltransferase RsmG [Thermomicrobiales bacterium]